MIGRKKYARPQGMLWSENPGTLQNGLYIPTGYEIGADAPEDADPALLDQFIILSDDNRDPLEFSIERIENRQRMINGRMRSHHIADKLSLSTSWNLLPSRSYAVNPNFNDNDGPNFGKSALRATSLEYTTDGGAGGVELLDWYKNHTGPFWVFLAYDNYKKFGPEEGNANAAYGHLSQYNEVIEMFISDFSYSVEKRGGTNFDFWNISVTLEEV
jgi:hypothetical protein